MLKDVQRQNFLREENYIRKREERELPNGQICHAIGRTKDILGRVNYSRASRIRA
jgi:hypothetical protein